MAKSKRIESLED